jgi:glycosyltransferase involved in cell wall biosynthesis
LRDQGVEAVAATWAEASGGNQPDIVHLYNVDLPLTMAGDLARVREQWPGTAVVIHPIFWPWDVAPLLRAGDAAITYRALRNAVKARSTWPVVRRTLAAADAVVSCSDREAQLTARYFRLRRGPHWVTVRNGVWTRQWQRPRASPEARAAFLRDAGIEPVQALVALVGRVEPLKNQRNLVRALSLLPDVGLVLVGARRDAPYADRIFHLANRLLPQRWTWLGVLTHDAVSEVLAMTDVHVLPAFRDVAALSSLEAAAAGCEVVVSRAGSATEYFGDRAHHTDADRPRAIADAIADALSTRNQPELRRHIESNYDWARAGAELAATYERVQQACAAR